MSLALHLGDLRGASAPPGALPASLVLSGSTDEVERACAGWIGARVAVRELEIRLSPARYSRGLRLALVARAFPGLASLAIRGLHPEDLNADLSGVWARLGRLEVGLAAEESRTPTPAALPGPLPGLRHLALRNWRGAGVVREIAGAYPRLASLALEPYAYHERADLVHRALAEAVRAVAGMRHLAAFTLAGIDGGDAGAGNAHLAALLAGEAGLSLRRIDVDRLALDASLAATLSGAPALESVGRLAYDLKRGNEFRFRMPPGLRVDELRVNDIDAYMDEAERDDAADRLAAWAATASPRRVHVRSAHLRPARIIAIERAVCAGLEPGGWSLDYFARDAADAEAVAEALGAGAARQGCGFALMVSAP